MAEPHADFQTVKKDSELTPESFCRLTDVKEKVVSSSNNELSCSRMRGRGMQPAVWLTLREKSDVSGH